MESCRTRRRPYWGSPGIREQDKTNTVVCCSDKAPSLPPPLIIRLISTDSQTFGFFCVKIILNLKLRSVLLSASEHSWYDQFRREDITCCYDVSPYCLTVFNPEWETDWIILQMLAHAVLGAHGNLTKLALFSCWGRAEETCEMMHDGSVTETEDLLLQTLELLCDFLMSYIYTPCTTLYTLLPAFPMRNIMEIRKKTLYIVWKV